MSAPSSHSFAEERRAAIMDMLDRTASVQVADLAQTFGVSAVTIRADLDALEKNGKLRRTHGGAVSLSKRLTVSIQDRRVNVNVEAKQAIAGAALELVDNGDALLVDSGTTIEYRRSSNSLRRRFCRFSWIIRSQTFWWCMQTTPSRCPVAPYSFENEYTRMVLWGATAKIDW